MVSNHNGRDEDNLPPTQGIYTQGGIKKGGPSEHGVPSSSSNMDELIHGLEWDAYFALLKAFTAQSEFLTWAKEGLMSTLRKELRITNEQHRQMLGIVGDDEALARVVTWRRVEKDPSIPLPPPPIFQSRKKQKTSHASPFAPLLKPPPRHSIKTSTSNGQGLPTQKMYSNVQGIVDDVKINVVSKGAPRPNAGRGGKRVGGPTLGSHMSKSEGCSADESWVGRSLWIRWSKDNILYKALILGYDKEVKMHRVVYDKGTPHETWEWIDLTKMGAHDIQWLDDAIDLVSQDGKGHDPLGFLAKQIETGGFRLPMEKSNGRDEERRPSGKSLQAPTMLQSRLGRGEALIEVDNDGTKVKYPEVARFVKEMDALEHEKDLEKLEDGKRMVKEYEEMLQKALAMVTNFSIDGESKEDGDSSDNGDSSDESNSSDNGDSSTNDDSNTDADSSDDGDSSGQEVNFGCTSSVKLDHGKDNGDNDDYIEID